MDTAEEKYTYIKYIRSKEKPADIMTNNCGESDQTIYAKRIT